MPGYFEDVSSGQVVGLGHAVVGQEALDAFLDVFAPEWDPSRGLPDSLVYVVWCKLDTQASAEWPQTKRVATDALRFARNPAAGELLRGRMTVLGKDPVGETKGIVLAQHDLLDEAGRLVFSCLTRSVFACRNEPDPDEI
jgi:hypothetical protein